MVPLGGVGRGHHETHRRGPQQVRTPPSCSLNPDPNRPQSLYEPRNLMTERRRPSAVCVLPSRPLGGVGQRDHETHRRGAQQVRLPPYTSPSFLYTSSSFLYTIPDRIHTSPLPLYTILDRTCANPSPQYTIRCLYMSILSGGRTWAS